MGFIALLICIFSAAIALPLEGQEAFEGRRIQEPALLPATFESFDELSSKTLNTNEFIFGGNLAQPGDIPMQAFLRFNTTSGLFYSCGGTLITPTHILTAAHCTFDMRAPARIMVGGVNTQTNTSTTQWRHIHRVYVHQGYNRKNGSNPNDISIVQFSPAVNLTNEVKLANLVKDDSAFVKIGHGLTSGYGVYKFDGKYANVSVTSHDLRYTRLSIYSDDYCISHKRQPRPFLKGMQLCAGYRGRGVGGGDSGGPIQAVQPGGLVQLGIASYAAAGPYYYKFQDQFPVSYTRVSYYCGYIDRVTKGAAKCK
ncbi:hypothetical protein QR680_014490 [Steinernema hermaphroditum]|uniref:Peptidase S1 domain-containing protein n=1 Tax=Steinernema hermaphroditum TaxID=289476 RepID=A0AA39IAN5_9BILA|nr:hypothetical protein QR680_014490 [Steinernema hermaphroditum]